MELKMTLSLPRDGLTIPVVRRILSRSMEVLGVDTEVREDVEVAITEACTNVLDHAHEGDQYEVTCSITPEVASIVVLDTGNGFDADTLGLAEADQAAEAGRGIQLIRALVDNVRFESRPEKGTMVHLEKALRYADDGALRRLAAQEGR